MASIVSDTFETRAGSGTVTIEHPNLTNTNSEKMSVSDIGSIEIEFDIDEETDANAQSLYFIPQKFNFSAFDKLSGGTSLFDRLDTDLLSTDEINVTFDFTTDGGLTWDDETTFTLNDIEYNRFKREVSFECFYKLEPNQTTISDIFSTYFSDVYTFNEGSGSGTRDCMAVNDFIENVFNSIKPGDTIIKNSNSFSNDPFVNGNQTWVVFKDHDGSVYEQTDSSLNALYRLAAVDGSVVGNALGYLFFTYRLDTTEDVTIAESDVVGGEDGLKLNPGLKNYRALSVWAHSVLGTTGVLNWGSHGFNYGNSDDLNDDAIKELHVTYQMLELQPASWSTSSPTNEFVDDGFATFNDTGVDLTDDLPEGALIVPISGSSGLTSGDNFWFSDKRELYEVDSATSSEIVMKSPLRRDIDAQFSTGGNKGIFEELDGSRGLLSSGAADAYKRAYGADNSRLISLQLFDIDTLKPYETITFGSSFPDVLQGLTYRPSRLRYDLVKDRIEVDAYEIG